MSKRIENAKQPALGTLNENYLFNKINELIEAHNASLPEEGHDFMWALEQAMKGIQVRRSEWINAVFCRPDAIPDDPVLLDYNDMIAEDWVLA